MKIIRCILKKRRLPGIFLATFFIFLISLSMRVFAEKPIVVVLDPGHGGENLGALYNGYVEKDMNLIVARAMKEELEKYEHIRVYLTHEDEDMSLKERAEFAAAKKADFLFSLHFNMSETHMLYGTEVWISAFDTFYAKGHAFGQIQMAAYQEMGLFSRGIKTRIGKTDEDYYGIIRESKKLGIDAILIEHCHLDHLVDQAFYALGDFQLEEFGQMTATSVAKFYQLKSSVLGVDYSDFPVPAVAVPTEAVRPDLTPPDLCHIELISLDVDERVAVFNLMAIDYDSRVLYYGISFDGGNNFEMLKIFPEGESELTITVNLPPGKDLKVIAAAYNAYDRITESNIIEIGALPSDVLEEIEEILEDLEEMIDISLTELTQTLTKSQEQMKQSLKAYQFIIIGIIALMVLLVMIVISRIFLFKRSKKRLTD